MGGVEERGKKRRREEGEEEEPLFEAGRLFQP